MTDVPPLMIQYWHIEKLIPYARNPRRNDQAVERMCSSIQQFGFRVPVLARSNGECIDGHLRTKAAEKLGSWPGGDVTKIPVILCDDWTPEQVKAFRLLVNRSVTWADWDEELLALELQELSTAHFDLSLTGFDSREIDRLLTAPADDAKADSAPPAPENPVSKLGDQWLCGPHRVLCGDTTSTDDVARLLDGRIPHLMVTDPPYSVSLDPAWRQNAGLQNNTRQSGKVANDDRADWTPAWELFPGNVSYVWHAGIHASVVATSLAMADFEIRAQIIWKKQRFVISRGAYHWGHEPCWYAVRHGKSANWHGDRKQSTVWEVDNLVATNRTDDSEEPENAITGHGTQKPVELFRRPICNHTKRGGLIYDPFLGSGTALAAAQVTDRVCYGLELDPKYVDVIVKRWEELTGEKATLDGDGRTLSQVATQRLNPTECEIEPDMAGNA
jgi:DNA modification methylase